MAVNFRGKRVLLSNTHIFGGVGTEIVQPSPADGGKSIIGKTIASTQINFNGDNEVDAALCYSDREIAVNILDIGVVNSIVSPSMFMKVFKSGRTTGYTSGKIIATNGKFPVLYSNMGVANFTGLIVTTEMGKPGDSGSILVDEYRRAVGLLFAGSENVTLYIPFSKIISTFRGISFI
jgi:hypothetical protein